jgi:hypothetical protein
VGVSDYFLTVPPAGPYRIWLIVLTAAFAAVAFAAGSVAKRTGYSAIKRRARSLRVITGGLAIVVTLHLLARAAQLDVISWRLWPYLFGLYFLGRLAWWLVGLRSLQHDKVDELNRNRKQLYFNKSRRKPAKRRRRR